MVESRRLLRAMLGDALRRIRLEQGRTLADVARDARVSMPYLSELERGLKEASSEVLAAICDALHVNVPDLLALIADTEIPTAQVITLDRISTDPAPAPVSRPGPGNVVCQLAA